jgi:two-component system, chemotaxis family, sensor kinase CheA
MIEMIRDPLTHIVRNAIDHGLETPKERQRAGKREIGLLTVSAHQSGNQILIAFTDDGRGIDDARLVEKAVAAGLLDTAQAARLSKRERYDLMFHPGLTTSDEVTSISGRGVGMDVVRSNIERIGGVVDIDSTAGEGTRLTLRVPLTLTIISALTVSSRGQQFAIPRSNVEELVMANDQAIEVSHVGDATLTMIRDRRLPSLSLAQSLGHDATTKDADQTLVVLKMASGDLFTLAVDRVHDHEELVIKPAAPAVMAAGIYAGTTLAADGSPILLLDVAGLADAGGLRFQHKAHDIEEEAAEPTKPKRQLLLFTGLNGRRQAMPLAVIDRILELDASGVQFSAGQMRVVIDEEILPLVGLDESAVPQGKVHLFRLTDGHSHVCYAIAAADEMRTVEEEIVPSATYGEIEGVILIDGEQTELIDPHWVFARHSAAPVQEKPLVCLRPLVEAAGYVVVDETADVTADLAICSSDEALPARNAAQTIWLRERQDEESSKQGSIYRYDRHGLMTALKLAGLGRDR